MNLDPSTIHDPFEFHRADRLAFLATPGRGPGAAMAVTRGAHRVFEATQRSGANAAATGYAVGGDATSVSAQPGPVHRTSDFNEHDPSNDLPVDIATLTPEEVCQLMVACATHLMQSMHRTGERFVP